MEIVCLDMEGTLTPEIWERVALNTGIKDLGKTTRDIPSYEELNLITGQSSIKKNIFLEDFIKIPKSFSNTFLSASG